MLYKRKVFPQRTQFIAYSKKKMNIVEFLTKDNKDNMKVKASEMSEYNEFIKKNHFVRGQYDSKDGYIDLNNTILKINQTDSNRIYYLALPAILFSVVANNLKKYCMAPK
jgi:glucose-6-phosphate 1-dehydrogenase